MFKLRQEADSVWENDCQWEVQDVDETGLPWLAAGGLIPQDEHAFDHASAFVRLGRNAAADHWVGRMAERVHNAMVDVPLELYERWAAMEHQGLWQELAPMLAHGAWETVLEAAGTCGNRIAFELCPRELCLKYVQGGSIPHPKVALWLVGQGFMPKSELSSHVHKEAFSLDDYWFMNCPQHEPLAPEFVADMCRLMLGEYGLSQEQKVRVVAQATLAFGYEAWEEHIEPVCRAYLEDVDLDLVHALCDVRIMQEETESSLHLTLRCATQDRGEAFDPTAQMDLDWISSEGGRVHEGLALLLNLTPPKDRIELYALAKTAQDIDLGFVSQAQQLPLPEGF